MKHPRRALLERPQPPAPARDVCLEAVGELVAGTPRQKTPPPPKPGFPYETSRDPKTRDGRFKLQRVTSKKRMWAKLREVKTELKRRRHLPVPDQERWLASVVRGHYAY